MHKLSNARKIKLYLIAMTFCK